MDFNATRKIKEQEENLKGMNVLLSVFSLIHLFLSITRMFYASDYKFIYRPKILDNQEIKLIKGKPILNKLFYRLN
jgi:hypothetical protein